MNLCFVCGAALDAEKPNCPQCSTSLTDLVHLMKVYQKPRFLFGSRKQAGLPTSVGPTQATPPPPAPVKKAPKVAKPFVAEEPLDRLDLIRNRDPIIEEEKTPQNDSPPLKQRAPAHMADLALVFTLNGMILQIILWFSHRNFQDLVTFSLLPILFVLLCFTFLYFWLFLGLFKKTLGALLIEHYTTASQNQSPPLP